MFNYSIHENGWTVFIHDFDIRTATQEDINKIAKLIATNTCVVIKNQSLTVADEVRILKMFKDPQVFDTNTKEWENYEACIAPGSENMAFRVTGELDEKGRIGAAGHVHELHWHCNDATDPNRRSIIWLYAVKGSKGSRTTWNNNMLSYELLDKERRDKLEHLTWIPYTDVDQQSNIFTDLETDQRETSDVFSEKLVMENIAGKKGFYFPFLQIYCFNGMTRHESKELIEWLSEYTIQEKFCYHHDWEDGDIVISEQWMGIHKRWEFEHMDKRLLHRMACNFPDQDYKS